LRVGYGGSMDGDRAGAVLADRNGVIYQWPAQWEQVTGYSASDAVGRRVDLIVPPPFRSLHWRGFDRAMQTGRIKRSGKPFNTVALHRSGKPIPIRAALDLTLGADGTPTGASAQILGAGPAWMAWATRPLVAVTSMGKRRRTTSR
jgi:PAS domain S-box-containing protein